MQHDREKNCVTMNEREIKREREYLHIGGLIVTSLLTFLLICLLFTVYFLLFIALFTKIISILEYITRRDIRKLNCTSSKKQNVRSDQSSLSFRVGYCHRQLIGMNMYSYKV